MECEAWDKLPSDCYVRIDLPSARITQFLLAMYTSPGGELVHSDQLTKTDKWDEPVEFFLFADQVRLP